MIPRHEIRTPKEAAQEFGDWASLFAGELFMKLVAYADESGTHDKTGVQKGSRETVVGGIVAPKEEWTAFCKNWQLILNRYDADHFHFKEWAIASRVARKKLQPSSDFEKNPYRDWKLEKLDAFRIDLARIAGEGDKIIIGGAVYTKLFHEAKLSGDVPIGANPHEHALDQFFGNTLQVIHTQRAPWKNLPISFFFDRSDNPEWTHAALDRFAAYQKLHRTFKEISFASKTDHLPLQAADMVAYRERQLTEQWVDGKSIADSTEFTEALFKSTFKFLDMHRREVLRAHFSGALDYEHSRKSNTV